MSAVAISRRADRLKLAVACMLACACSQPSSDADDGGGTTSGELTGTSSSTRGDATNDVTASMGSVTTESSADDASTTEAGPIDQVTVFLPRTSILSDELAVVVNEEDPLSVAIAEYYVQARGIPPANVISLSFSTTPVMSSAAFEQVEAELLAQLDDAIQALALTFTHPYRVDCMSVTSAFTLGFDPMWCNTTGGACGPTAPSPYYDSSSLAPQTDHGMRPSMMIAAVDFEQAKALIDRGLAADGTYPTGDGYMIRTTDSARSVRWPVFTSTVTAWEHEGGLVMQYIDNANGTGLDYIERTHDVLFYFTGLVSVPAIATHQYLPGAVADHLTSFGGQVPDSSQMSALRWLEAGATGSFGTVVEPCNYTAKFPDTSILLPHYFRGQTLVEAYWKSVHWPGEGLFIGEPLARPWDGSTVELVDGDLHVTTTLLEPGIDYHIEKSSSADGPWELVFSGSIPKPQTFTLVVPEVDRPYYRVVRAN
jgi:uncharacterized protein (TIGR03790 family)